LSISFRRRDPRTENPDEGLILQEIFNTQYFRVYTHTDVTGVELGGALKNVIAIASAISDGLGLAIAPGPP